ncbi:hypothetical protein [Planomicrobium okeanokoites]|uniref:hypothetical protein n=1 Tax=Planomicrobium okeanokoites TaxID=244 RepID=UPI0024909E68|nr:hypothetical protein [Planomicrobium okeanokoites]
MLKLLLFLASIITAIVHLSIFLIWLFDWTILTTETGLITWVASIATGVLIYTLCRRFNNADKRDIFTKRLIFTSTLMTVALALLSAAIEIAVRSMP